MKPIFQRDLRFRIWHDQERRMIAYARVNRGTPEFLSIVSTQDQEKLTTTWTTKMLPVAQLRETFAEGALTERLIFPGFDIHFPFLGEDYVITQFTGLHDTAGRPIYEGDVVELSFSGHDPIRGPVEFFEATAGFGIPTNNRKFAALAGERVMVLGNIFEHPDLLPPIPTNA